MTVARTDIVQAKLNRVSFVRLGDGSVPPVKVELTGVLIDSLGLETGSSRIDYDWTDLPAAWRTALLPILQGISKEFNNIYANENVETI